MSQTVERYHRLRARAMVVNSGTSCVVIIRPVWSEYLGILLAAVMYFCTLWAASVAFMNPFGKSNFFEWAIFIFVTAFVGFAFWAQSRRATTTEISADRNGMTVSRRFFGVPRTFEIKNGVLENVRWYSTKELKGYPWHSFFQVLLPNGKEIMLANELSEMDERFGERVMALLADVTGWKSDVKRIYVEPTDPSSGSSGP